MRGIKTSFMKNQWIASKLIYIRIDKLRVLFVVELRLTTVCHDCLLPQLLQLSDRAARPTEALFESGTDPESPPPASAPRPQRTTRPRPRPRACYGSRAAPRKARRASFNYQNTVKYTTYKDLKVTEKLLDSTQEDVLNTLKGTGTVRFAQPKL